MRLRKIPWRSALGRSYSLHRNVLALRKTNAVVKDHDPILYTAMDNHERPPNPYSYSNARTAHHKAQISGRRDELSSYPIFGQAWYRNEAQHPGHPRDSWSDPGSDGFGTPTGGWRC
jgi:hypothetical protein